MERTNTPPPSRATRVKSYLLGGFFLFQLVYLPTANFVQYVPRELPKQEEEIAYTWQEDGKPPPVVGRPIAWIGQACEFWADVTGQHQGWGMFAPVFPRNGVFPVVIMEFDGAGGVAETIVRYSRFEPSDPQAYYRPPSTWHRFFNFEVKMSLPYAFYPLGDVERKEEADDAVILFASRLRRSMRAYLSWQVMQALRERTDLPMPDRVFLGVRIHPPPMPGSRNWPAMVEMPVLRWEPGENAIYVWDAKKSDFVRLTGPGGR